ncbi:MAG: DNA-binding protein [Planctomycetota bacterium]|nr:MAG: DNA-binding protein [Planctomycetota bacterium]
MVTISKVEELTDELVKTEILRLLRGEAKILDKKGRHLLQDFQFKFSDEDLIRGPIGQKMAKVFDFVRKKASFDPTEIHQYCIDIIEFIWPSEFSPHYSIPDDFWETPLGFAIYEVVGKIENAPENKDLSTVQAAKYLGITLSELQRLVEQGYLKPATPQGPRRSFLVRDLEKARKYISG